MSILKHFIILIVAAVFTSCGITSGLDSYDDSVTSDEFYATCDVTVIKLPEGAEEPPGRVVQVTYTQPIQGPVGGFVNPSVDCSELEIIYSIRKEACARGVNTALITHDYDPVRNGYCYTCVVNFYNVSPADSWFVELTKETEAMKRYSYHEITSRMEANEEEANRKDRRDTWIAVGVGIGSAVLGMVLILTAFNDV